MSKAVEKIEQASNLSPPSPRAPSMAARALSIPEILLHIFSFINSGERFAIWARCARVASSWREPSETSLYSNLYLKWRFSKIDQFARCLDSRPALYQLVHSLSVFGFEHQELKKEVGEEVTDWESFYRDQGIPQAEPGWTNEDRQRATRRMAILRHDKEWELLRQHVDSYWMDEGPSGQSEGFHQSFSVLLELIGKLSNLQHLQVQFSGVQPPRAITLSPPAEKVLQNITSLSLCCGYVPFAQAVTSPLRDIRSVNLYGDTPINLTFPPLPHILHVTLHHSRHFLIVEHSRAALETLTLMDDINSTSLPRDLSLPQLSHLHVCLHGYNKDKANYVKNILRMTPHAVYVSLHVYSHFDLRNIIPILLPTLETLPSAIKYIWISVTKGAKHKLGSVRLLSSTAHNFLVNHAGFALKQIQWDDELKRTNVDWSPLISQAGLLELEVVFLQANRATLSEVETMMTAWRASRLGDSEFRG